jgi:hypothetical protein
LSESEFKDTLLCDEKFKLQLELATGMEEYDLEYTFDTLGRKPKEKRLTDGRELEKEEFIRRYGVNRAEELWAQATTVEKRTNRKGEEHSKAEFLKRHGKELGEQLWEKADRVEEALALEPSLSQHEFIDGLMRRAEPITELQFVRLEKKIHDVLDSLGVIVHAHMDKERAKPTVASPCTPSRGNLKIEGLPKANLQQGNATVASVANVPLAKVQRGVIVDPVDVDVPKSPKRRFKVVGGQRRWLAPRFAEDGSSSEDERGP